MADAWFHRSMMPRWACALGLVAAALAFAHPGHAAEALATVTIQQGKAVVIRGTTRLAPLPGARLAAEDIVETPPAASLLRIEFDDGSLLDLGPSTRVMIMPSWPEGQGHGRSLAYVLGGWVKLTKGSGAAAAPLLLSTAALEVAAASRAVVLHVQGRDARAFAESGKVTVRASAHAHAQPAADVELNLAPGQFLTRHGDAPASVMARPPTTFIQEVPVAFMDTLPARAPLFKGKDPAMSPGTNLGHADVQAWLEAEPRIRRRFTSRWRPLLQDPAFRQAVAAHLNAHPEWRPILYPPHPPIHQRTAP